ncbi:hypothetical protein PRIPAC_92016 [Pristionchus pacificus]|uniref:Uncharacterized protein n=1 Tax=Pristionchus pacificus TaxID=54126 RepID=A0A2A6CIC7_PRIPA|nr:hypothetical protein PRIPAC_92016 [Pristionchus pacificus]|eukprot:PDM77813.1 hypothetical protein PRIPAC_34680 [Pristionchus pacificus]
MLIVGLSGGIATGKSTVSGIFEREGIPVIDADRIAREVVKPGESAWHAIREEFGAEYFDDDRGGVMNREKVGQLIFNNAEKRRRLNAITHPAVRKRMLYQAFMHFITGASVIVLDTPLLFEVGYDRILSRTICVWCNTDQELERLIARDGMSETDAKSRMRAQMSLDEKKKRATILLDNTGTKEELEAQVLSLVATLRSSWTPTVIRATMATVIVGIVSLMLWRFF